MIREFQVFQFFRIDYQSFSVTNFKFLQFLFHCCECRRFLVVVIGPEASKGNFIDVANRYHD